MQVNFSPLNIHVSLSPALEAALITGLATENATLARIEGTLDAATQKENTIMLNVQALTDAVARETTVDESVLALVTSMAQTQKDLSKQLADAVAANDPVAIAAVQKAIDDSAAKMTANADAIVAAVNLNTAPQVQP